MFFEKNFMMSRFQKINFLKPFHRKVLSDMIPITKNWQNFVSMVFKDMVTDDVQSRILVISNFRCLELFVDPLNFSINSRPKYVRYLEYSISRTFAVSNQLFGPLNCFSLVISNFCSNLCKSLHLG